MNIFGVVTIIVLTVIVTLYAKDNLNLNLSQSLIPPISSKITPNPSVTSTPTTPPPADNSPSPTPTKIKFKTSDVNNSKLIYPSSTITSQSGDTINLDSLDSPDSIASWYQSLSEQMNFNIKNFVKTNSNGLINDKLESSSSDRQLSVSITKKPDNNHTAIIVIYTVNKSI